MNCIEVATAKGSSGYGQTSVHIGASSRYSIRAHRVAFEQAWGIRLQPGQVVRHSCDNRGCINPLHLMVGSIADNNRDTSQRGRSRPWNGSITHCKRGHELTKHNGGRSRCRTCNRERLRARRIEASRG